MPLDERLREELRRDVEPVLPDTERHLAAVRDRTRAGTSTTTLLVAAAATVAVIAVLVLGILPGSHPTRPGATAIPTPGTTTATPTGLAGTEWTVTLLATDPGVVELGLAGDWTLRLRDTAALEIVPPPTFVTPAGATLGAAAWALTGRTFVTNLFSHDFGGSCTGPGDYQITYRGSDLGFVGRDTCQARRVLLTTRPWTADR